jgi:2-succinyl-5-enolpyruvyl-6-hydroxy-3-cyclohexene-1-carboxylate synthase
MPLVPTPENVAWTPQPSPVKALANENPIGKTIDLPARGVVVAGDIVDIAQAREVGKLAQQLGWPIIAEPSANVHTELNTLAHGVLVVASNKLAIPDCVLTIGTVGLSRPILNLLKETSMHIAVQLSGNGPDLPDPVQGASEVLTAVPVVRNEVDSKWLTSWQKADALIGDIVSEHLQAQTLTGPSACLQVWSHAQESDQLMVAASWPVRHLEAFAPKRNGLHVFGNRGANGIDGLISTAWGLSEVGPARTYLLIGDIAFLHDIGGLNFGESTQQTNLTVVVLDNDGGGIFSQLEQGRAEFEPYFEKVFGTPHGKDLWQIAESFGFATTRVTTKDELASALKRTSSIQGVHIIICLTGERTAENALIQNINREIAQVLSTSA